MGPGAAVAQKFDLRHPELGIGEHVWVLGRDNVFAESRIISFDAETACLQSPTEAVYFADRTDVFRSRKKAIFNQTAREKLVDEVELCGGCQHFIANRVLLGGWGRDFETYCIKHKARRSARAKACKEAAPWREEQEISA